MELATVEAWLERKKVKPTANRILVLKALKNAGKPMSIADLEDTLLTVDKSSIFRVLTLFLEHDIVHAFEDGRGVLNYELCTNEGACNLSDAHIHFYCESCRQSFCMETCPSPTLLCLMVLRLILFRLSLRASAPSVGASTVERSGYKKSTTYLRQCFPIKESIQWKI